MEYLVRLTKRHIKHMFSNKTTTNITKRSRAIAGISDISENYDTESHLLIRAKKHSDISSDHDELRILEDLRLIRPFLSEVGREHNSFKNIPQSIVDNLVITEFRRWMTSWITKSGPELGN